MNKMNEVMQFSELIIENLTRQIRNDLYEHFEKNISKIVADTVEHRIRDMKNSCTFTKHSDGSITMKLG